MYFRNEYDFLSNMYPAPVTIPVAMEKGTVAVTFPTVENAFQALKCVPRCRQFTCVTPIQAKAMGRRVTLRPDWEEVKDGYMERLVRAKFHQHPELMERLEAIDGPIVEDNSWGDREWGVCRGEGENKLGKILEKIRDEAKGNMDPGNTAREAAEEALALFEEFLENYAVSYITEIGGGRSRHELLMGLEKIMEKKLK